jgi:hypothetical protein
LLYVHCPGQKVHPFHLVNVGHLFPFLCLIPPLRIFLGNHSAQSALPCFVIKLSGRRFVFVSVAIFCLPIFYCSLSLWSCGNFFVFPFSEQFYHKWALNCVNAFSSSIDKFISHYLSGHCFQILKRALYPEITPSCSFPFNGCWYLFANLCL